MIICLVAFRQIIEEILFYTEYNTTIIIKLIFEIKALGLISNIRYKNSCLPSDLLLIDRCIIFNVLPVTLVLYNNDNNEIKIISL